MKEEQPQQKLPSKSKSKHKGEKSLLKVDFRTPKDEEKLETIQLEKKKQSKSKTSNKNNSWQDNKQTG